MTLAELVDSWRSGLVTGDVLCRRAGTVEWMPLRDIPEVRVRMSSSPPPPMTDDG